MDIRIYRTEQEIGEAAGKIYVDYINENPSCVLGFATGACGQYGALLCQYVRG